MTAPVLSVIVPVFRGESLLPSSLGALRASQGLPDGSWELIVVDDASDDDTALVAERWADRVIRSTGGPGGPGRARNRGAEAASGDVLVFIDADVCVHADTLARFRTTFQEHPETCAVFGAYDDGPVDPTFLSQYRNLYHRYVHLLGAGEASTFWAGCGAVRRDAFLAVGGFDAEAFARPQIEDIELGYRLREAGGRILLDPEIQGRHLKRWSFVGIVRTDLFDRGVPWMRRLLRHGARGEGTLNVRPGEKLKTALVGGAAGLALLGVITMDASWLFGAVAALMAVILLNLDLYRWFASLRGWGFAVRVIPMNILYYFLSGTAVVIAWALHIGDRLRHRGAGVSGDEGRAEGARAGEGIR